MEPLRFFDSNCMVGRRSVPRPENNLSLEDILAELERAGIDDALAVHAYAKEYDPHAGNERLSAICADHPHLHACYVVLPHQTGEMPAGDGLLKYFQDGRAKAVRLYPRDHNYGMGERWTGGLFSTLEDAGVPALIDLDQTTWPEVDAVLTAHPALVLVVMRVGYRIDRWVYPLLAAHRGLKLETSFYELHLAIEAVTERFGPERLVFGTGLPVWDAGGALSPILYAAIPDAARRRIAGETLRSILWKGGLS
ncbi:MAG: amidohydrolase family protein [Candidatus Latescibacteria bacterium]|nr:amidohydrolase family protein [Candidatus Latescibacterota bacterium]